MIGTTRTISPAISVEEALHSRWAFLKDLATCTISNWLTVVKESFFESTTPSSIELLYHQVNTGLGVPATE